MSSRGDAGELISGSLLAGVSSTASSGSPVPMVINISNQRNKLVAVRESFRSLQSHKLAA
jgi:hypothetical protein